MRANYYFVNLQRNSNCGNNTASLSELLYTHGNDAPHYKQLGAEERNTSIVFVFDSTHNDARLQQRPKTAPLSSPLQMRVSISSVCFSSRAAPIDL